MKGVFLTIEALRYLAQPTIMSRIIDRGVALKDMRYVLSMGSMMLNDKASIEDVVLAAKIAQAHGFISSFPKGYNTILDQGGVNLSGGQKQRIAIARAVLANPSILILDEATSSVDTRTELRVQKAMLKIMKGRTSFIIAHRLSTIKDADIIMVIDDGEIIEKGSHSELIDYRGKYYDMHYN